MAPYHRKPRGVLGLNPLNCDHDFGKKSFRKIGRKLTYCNDVDLSTLLVACTCRQTVCRCCPPSLSWESLLLDPKSSSECSVVFCFLLLLLLPWVVRCFAVLQDSTKRGSSRQSRSVTSTRGLSTAEAYVQTSILVSIHCCSSVLVYGVHTVMHGTSRETCFSK